MFVHSSSVHAFVLLSVLLMTDRGRGTGWGISRGTHVTIGIERCSEGKEEGGEGEMKLLKTIN